MAEQEVIFDYHYEEEADRYSFFRIPKALYTEVMFSKLSDGAKVLYGQLLDLMALSRKNGWIDGNGRVYIRCSIERIKAMMNCGNEKAVNILRELDVNTGIGLIEKEKQGQGKMTIIYVKSFVVLRQRGVKDDPGNGPSDSGNPNSGNPNTRIPETRIQEFRKPEFKNSGNPNTGIPETRIQEFRKPEFKNSDNPNTRIPETGILVFRKPESNNTYITNNNLSDSDYINPIYPPEGNNEPENRDSMDLIRAYTEIVKENIEYDNLAQELGYGDKEVLQELLDIVVETVSCERDTVRIAGANYPFGLVRSKLLKLNATHIRYAMDCLNKSTTKKHNIKAYLLTTLYNAPSTIDSYYRSEAKHDMANKNWEVRDDKA